MFTMARSNSNAWILNDHVSLPIIISDWDADKEPELPFTNPQSSSHNRESSISSIQSNSSTASTSKWSTGFGYYFDDLFGRMTDSMKRKLREAFVEVLRRTDGTNADQEWPLYDEDARFLD